MRLEEARWNLLQTARQNRPYAFFPIALPYLEQVPDDAEIRLLALSELARLGLVGPALELVETQPEIAEHSPDLCRALTLLRNQPTGHIPWAQLSRHFETNLKVALQRFESCRACERELRRDFKQLDLFRCKDGNYQLSRRVGNGPRRWLPALLDWQAAARQAKLLPDNKDILCPPFFLEGVGFGEVLRETYNGTQKMFLSYRPRIHLLEPNPTQLAVWLHLDDSRDILADERFHLWLGPHGVSAFLAFHRECPQRVPPRSVLRQPGWGTAREAFGSAAINTLADEHEATAQRHLASIREKLATRSDFGYYAARFENCARQPLRVLAVTSRFTTFLQYSMRDILQTLEEGGHQTKLITEPDDHTPVSTRSYLLSQIDKFVPDLLLIIDHNRHEYGDTYNVPIPFCNWIQDELPHLFGPNRGRNLNPYDVVIGHISEQTARESGYPPRQCHRAPVPVNPRVFSNEPVADADRNAAECDLSFVSNLSITADRFLRESVEKCTQPEIRRLLEALYEILGPRIAAGGVPATRVQTEGVIQQTARELGFQLSDEDAAKLRRQFVERLVNIFFRHQPLLWAHDLGLKLHLYGRGWEQHPQLGQHARGVAANGYHLRSVFQATRINLQLLPGAGVHQRLLEGLASGGFFLIRGTPYDAVQKLFADVARRCVKPGIRSDTALWQASDPQLARDIRKLSDVIYAPRELPKGVFIQLRDYVEFGHQLDMPNFLPRYGEVRFAAREEFEHLVTRYLADDDARREIAAEQRQRILATFTYNAVILDVFRFLADYFAERAAAEKTSRSSAGSPCPA